MSHVRKRRSVRTETCDEDDTLRLAHMFRSIRRRASIFHAYELVRAPTGMKRGMEILALRKRCDLLAAECRAWRGMTGFYDMGIVGVPESAIAESRAAVDAANALGEDN